MNTTKKVLFTLSLVVLSAAVFYAATPAQAATTVQNLMERIASLKAQIAMLEKQLFDMQNHVTPPWCYTFNRNLKFGDGGNSVANLQIALSKEGFYTLQANGQGSGTFDENTASAVVQFQEKYAAEVLTPSGLGHGTGYVGQLTRAKLNQLYGCKDHSPVIHSISGPASLVVGQTGTWTIKATDQDDNPLSYSIMWGDEVSVASPMAALKSSGEQTTTFTHSYSATGDYVIAVTVTDTAGNSATENAKVHVIAETSNKPPVANNQYVTLTQDTSVTVTLTGSDPEGSPLTFMVTNGPDHGTLSGTAPNLTYKPNTGFTGTDSFMFRVNDGSLDSAEAKVSITVNPWSNHSPVIHGISGPVTLMVGQTGTWNIKVTDADDNPLSYSIMWGDEALITGLKAALKVSTEQTTSFTHMYVNRGTYMVAFHVTDSAGAMASGTITVEVK